MIQSRLLVVCGLAREGRLASGPNVVVVPGGGRRAHLEARLAELDPTRLDAVVSFGLAGALEPAFKVGDVLVPGEIRAEDGSWHEISAELAASWLRAAEAADLTIASRGAMIGIDAPATTTAAKTALRERSGAVAADMESHVAAAFAARHGLPFGVLRVVSDAADRSLPPAAIVAMREDGGIDVPAVLKSLAKQPGQTPALLAVGRDGARAFRSLGRAAFLLLKGRG